MKAWVWCRFEAGENERKHTSRSKTRHNIFVLINFFCKIDASLTLNARNTACYSLLYNYYWDSSFETVYGKGNRTKAYKKNGPW